MAFDLNNLDPAAVSFLTERHLATLSLVRPDGRIHVSPVGFTFQHDTATARIITSASARKTQHARTSGRAVLCQVDGGVWLTLEGTVRVSQDAVEVADAEARYGVRYQPPKANPDRVVLVVDVVSMYGRVR